MQSNSRSNWIQVLAETVVWCSRKNPPPSRECFRSKELLREDLGTKSLYANALGECEGTAILEVGPLLAADPQIVDRIVQARRQIVGNLKSPPIPELRDLVGYAPAMSVTLGLAEQETQGFFDTSECPGWETWVGWAHRGAGEVGWKDWLLCWIPPVYRDLADAAIEVDAVDCLFRAADQLGVKTLEDLIASLPPYYV